MDLRLFFVAGLLTLGICVQGITENQKEFRKKRNVPIKLPTSLDQLQIQSQSQSQIQISGDITCDPACEHGSCVSGNKCSCESGWSGPTCSEFECSNVCVHGRCVGPNTCNCNTGWGGDSCEEAVCDTECLNGGSCDAPNTCTCKIGWSGQSCGSPVCEKECQNGGSCDAPNRCVCADGFDGTLCQIALPKDCKFPFEYNGNLYSACTTVGSTDGKAWCSTTTAFQDNWVSCDYNTLCNFPGELLEIPGDCKHYYTCTADGVSLTACPVDTVFNVYAGGCDTLQNTPHCQHTCAKECLNGGNCVAQDTCECPEGFIGNQCEINIEEALEGSGEPILPFPSTTPRVCNAWGKGNFYTFDGLLFPSDGRCGYQLTGDCARKDFSVSLHYDADTLDSKLKIDLTDGPALELSQGVVTYNGKEIEVPSVVGELHIFPVKNTDYVMVNAHGRGWLVAWDQKDNYFFKIIDQDTWAGKVCGLCGNFNGDLSDDLTPKGGAKATDVSSFMNSWSLDSECSTETSKDYCGYLNKDQLAEVVNACSVVYSELQATSFAGCPVKDDVYEETCMWALCQCASGNYTQCICDATSQFSKLCIASGAHIENWRTPEFCAKPCPSNLIYKECGSACQATCHNKNQDLMCTSQCVDGCFCPPGTYLDGDKCVKDEECSCTHQGVIYASGDKRSGECEECTCSGGLWSCDAVPCYGECAATGDPHYRTFDGLSYMFSGQCQYVLSTDACNTSNYTFAIVTENVKCGIDGAGVCTKAATLVLRNDFAETKYHLKQGGVVAVGDNDVLLPYNHGDVKINFLSSIMIQLKTVNGIEIEWDGAMRLYVKLDPSWKNSVCGMCGNFNSKSNDDMKTPQNSIETNVGAFGNSWKVNSECPDADCPREPIIPEACLVSHDKKSYAEEVCGVLKSDTFKACHAFVNWGTYYYNCRNDVCNCGEGKECMCESFADYARACAEKGVIVEWRNDTLCPMECDEGMEYKECAGYCEATCRSIGDADNTCEKSCHPGCVCADGLYLSEDGTCIEAQDCGCYYLGEMYNPNDQLTTGSQTCTCKNGRMECVQPPEEETCVAPLNYVNCSALPKGSRGIACIQTCRNQQQVCTAQHCVSGCGCPEGTIKDENFGTCVQPSKCSCLSNGEIYQPGESRPEGDCNTCTCTGGSWSCTEKACPAECSSVGDPHYTTFDGQKFDYQGTCSYVMSEDFCGNETSGTFRVVMENSPCGNNEVSCPRAVSFYLYNKLIYLKKGTGDDSIQVSDYPEGPSPPAGFSYNVRIGSIYYIVETNVGIELLWNHENAAKIHLQPNYTGKVCGLCGNFDGDMNNDFALRGGSVVADPDEFGNDWKISETCPDSVADPHPCQENAERAPWAEKKCNILNSDIFKDCHAKVDPSTYYENCLYDTCGCDFGGDCECFCTSVAVYAQECAAAGVCINWRNNEVCPLMCESYNPGFGTGVNETCEWKYEPCGNPCPPTCNNRNPDCAWKQLEGCYVTCNEEEVWDEVNLKCIPESSCPTTTRPDIPVTTTTPTTPKTPPPTTTTTTTVTTTTTTPPPPTPCKCVEINGIAHEPGDTWPLRGDESLCIDVTCVEEQPGVCKTESEDKRVLCTEANKPVCQNGNKAVQVEDGCSCKWECQCYCFGQGDPHFFTFDGFYYPFQGNCTFVLSRDMNGYHTNHPHEYEIWMENVACEEAPDTTCTRKITIIYDSTHLALYENYTFTVNGSSVKDKSQLPMTADGIHVELRGVSLFYVTIKEIDLILTYTGVDYSWSLSVPYSKYFNRTEGLCGVCNNDQSDDFTNRTGVVVTDIEDFGDSWLVKKESEKCINPPLPCYPPPTPDKNCDIILSDVFKSCHAVVDPQIFYEICQYDTARCNTNYSYCEALFGYARICQHADICVNWRSDDICPLDCPHDRFYQACKPNCEQECSNYLSGIPCEDEELTEGCFCPPDTVLFNGECVESAVCTDCTDDDGKVYEYGESWVPAVGDCTICSCMEDQNILCTTKECPDGTNEIPDCPACYVAEMERGSDPCCPTYQCVCNYKLGSLFGYISDLAEDEGSGFSHEKVCGPVHLPRCEPGYIPQRTNPDECIPDFKCKCNATLHPCSAKPTCSDVEHLVTTTGECCPTYTCECNKCEEDTTECSACEDRWVEVDYCGCKKYSCGRKGVCNYNGTLHKPGEDWGSADPCETCTCYDTEIDGNGCYKHECYKMACDVFCPDCTTYTPVPGQCCGTCEVNGCEYTSADGKHGCQAVDESWEDMEKCVEYTCKAYINNTVNVVETPIKCPIYDIPECPACYEPRSFQEDCCTVIRCVPAQLCCVGEGPSIQLPGAEWNPDSCTVCKCLNSVNETSGFHDVECNNVPCSSFDKEQCLTDGGNAVPTDDGCCWKCDNKCIDNQNNTYKFGEVWRPDNCTLCSCTVGHEIVCSQVSCPPGFKETKQHCAPCEVSVRKLTTDPCCPVYDCVCNYALGQGEPNCDAVEVPKCPPGSIPRQTNEGECIPEYECVCNKSVSHCPEPPVCGDLKHIVTQDTECCPIQTCECKTCQDDTTACSPCEQAVINTDECSCRHTTCHPQNICIVNGAAHTVGEVWNPDACTTCTCTNNVDTETSCHVEHCFVETCDTICPSCQEYVTVEGQCCGECRTIRCPVTNQDGTTECKEPGDMWQYTSNCTEYICANGPSGDLKPLKSNFTCPKENIPECSVCENLIQYTEDCCTKFRCVQRDVCCDSGVEKLPGSTWAPDTCNICHCSDDSNVTSGFHVEKCFHVPCPPFDAEACETNGGTVIATDDGCCTKCQVSDCYECGRRISTKLEYMIVEECASTVPVSLSYCDGFCRGSYFWSSVVGSESQCSCCNPTATANRVTTMMCKNGTEFEYSYNEVTSCGCTSSCQPIPPPDEPVITSPIPPKPTPVFTTEPPEEGSGETTTPPVEAPSATTTTPPKPVPTTTEEEGSGETTTPPVEAPSATTTTPPKPVPTTTEEEGSGETTTPPVEAPSATTTTPPKPVPTTTEEEGSGETTTPPVEAPSATTTTPPKPVPTTTEEEGSGETTTPPVEAPSATTTTPPKPVPTTTEEEGSGETTTPPVEAPSATTTTPPKPVPTTTEEEGSGETTTPPVEAPSATTTTPPKPVPTTTEEEGSGETTTPPVEAPSATTTTPPKPVPTTTEEEGSGETTTPPVEAPSATTTTPPKPVPTTTEEEGSGETTTPPVEAPSATTTTPPKPVPTTTEEEGSGETTTPPVEAPSATTTTPPKPVPTTTEEEGSGETTTPPVEAPSATTTTPPKPVPTTTEEEGSGETTTPPVEAPSATTTTPPKPVPTTTEEEGSGETTTPPVEAPSATTTAPPKPVQTTTEEEGSGEITTPPVEAPSATTTTPPKPVPTTTEEEGSGETTTPPVEAPSATTTTPPKPVPTTTEEEGSGETTTPPVEAPSATTTTPPKPVPTTTEEEGSGETTTPPVEAPSATTTTPPKPVPTTTEEEGSGETTTPPVEAPSATTTTPPKPVPTTTEEEGSGETTTPPVEAPSATTTTPPKPVPTTTEEEGSGETTTPPVEAPSATTTTPPKPVPTTTEEEGSGETTTPPVEAPSATTTTPPKPVPTTTEEEGSGETTTPPVEAPSATTTTPPKPVPTTTEEEGSDETTTPPVEAPSATTTAPSKPVPTTTTLPQTTTPIPCYWTNWTSSDRPKLPYRDDDETFEHLIENGYEVCPSPVKINCRPVGGTVEDFEKNQEWQEVTCDVETGLLCLGSEQTVHPVCEDYEIQLYCCPESPSQSQSQSQSQSNSQQEVDSIEKQIQSILDELQNGETPSTAQHLFPGNGGGQSQSQIQVDGNGGIQLQGQHQIMQNIHELNSEEQKIDSSLQQLIGKLNSGSLDSGSETEQVQAQQQVQQQIQSINHEMQQQSELQHDTDSSIDQQIKSVLDSINSENSAKLPAALPKQAHNVVNQLSENAANEIESDQEMNADIQSAIHNLLQTNYNAESAHLQTLHDKTISELQNLEHNENHLLQEEQGRLNQLESINSNEYAALGNVVGNHVQSQQQRQTQSQSKRSELEREIEELAEQW
ncbi:von Willebrand factor-like isoform X2 [Clavelina lepadiformis]|uniref:von Willebrand factor-like isoform X2 n=1 Tax=Clavelina lepadiformis TaxID=159417 RepID=UPI0040427FC1